MKTLIVLFISCSTLFAQEEKRRSFVVGFDIKNTIDIRRIRNSGFLGRDRIYALSGGYDFSWLTIYGELSYHRMGNKEINFLRIMNPISYFAIGPTFLIHPLKKYKWSPILKLNASTQIFSPNKHYRIRRYEPEYASSSGTPRYLKTPIRVNGGLGVIYTKGRLETTLELGLYLQEVHYYEDRINSTTAYPARKVEAKMYLDIGLLYHLPVKGKNF